MRDRRVIISGGGTGGHLYPALVLGQKLREKKPDLGLIFVGSSRAAEKEIMAHHQVRFIPMKIEGLKGRGLRSFKTMMMLPTAFLKSWAILIRTKPGLVVGAGGYSSGPVVLLASLMGIPTLILEQNVRPGLTNRILGRWVKKAVVAFEKSLANFKGKGVCLGNPVRDEFYSLSPKKRDGSLTVLIFGGSQGSHFLNEAVLSALPLLVKEKDRLAIFHQTGPTDLARVKTSYARLGFENVEVAAFFYEMPRYFGKSDLIISRAGATTCAELIAAQKASLLIPFAQASENHQAANAAELKNAEGADVISEQELTAERLAEKIRYFLTHQETLTAMEKNLSKLKKDYVAEQIASLCLELMEARR